jgi:hypothetical protein
MYFNDGGEFPLLLEFYIQSQPLFDSLEMTCLAFIMLLSPVHPIDIYLCGYCTLFFVCMIEHMECAMSWSNCDVKTYLGINMKK